MAIICFDIRIIWFKKYYSAAVLASNPVVEWPNGTSPPLNNTAAGFFGQQPIINSTITTLDIGNETEEEEKHK